MKKIMPLLFAGALAFCSYLGCKSKPVSNFEPESYRTLKEIPNYVYPDCSTPIRTIRTIAEAFQIEDSTILDKTMALEKEENWSWKACFDAMSQNPGNSFFDITEYKVIPTAEICSLPEFKHYAKTLEKNIAFVTAMPPLEIRGSVGKIQPFYILKQNNGFVLEMTGDNFFRDFTEVLFDLTHAKEDISEELTKRKLGKKELKELLGRHLDHFYSPDSFGNEISWSFYRFNIDNTSNEILVYSVGPDKKDNKGKIIYDPANGLTSEGDIVVQIPMKK